MKTEGLVSAGTPRPTRLKSLKTRLTNSEWSQGVNDGENREQRYKRLLAVLRKQVRDLRRQLTQGKNKTHPSFIDEFELREMIDDVERERQTINIEHRQMEEERRQFLEEKQAIRQLLGQMETEMARERAEHNRQQAEMRWREESLHIARENLARERLVVEGLRHKMRH